MTLHAATPLLLCGLLGFTGLSTAAESATGDAPDPIAQLQSDDVEQLLAAAEALAQDKSRAAAALPILAQRLTEDPSADMRLAAAKALAAIGIADASLVDPLVRAMRDDAQASTGDTVAVEAGATVGRLELRGAAPHLVEMLRSDRMVVRRAASVAAHGMGADAAPAAPRLLELAQSTEPDDRYPALFGLMGVGPAAPQAVPVMIKLLDSEDFHTQYWACRVLGRIGAPAANPATPRLIELTRDGVASVRGNAVSALGEIGPAAGTQILDPMIAALGDSSFPVRQRAAVALGNLGTFARPAVPRLEAALEDPQFAAPSEAAAALIQATGKHDKALQVLLAEIQKVDAPMLAVQAFQRLGPQAQEAVPGLTKLLRSESAETRWCALLALDAIGPPARTALGEVEALLSDPDEDIRDSAQQLATKLRAP